MSKKEKIGCAIAAGVLLLWLGVHAYHRQDSRAVVGTWSLMTFRSADGKWRRFTGSEITISFRKDGTGHARYTTPTSGAPHVRYVPFTWHVENGRLSISTADGAEKLTVLDGTTLELADRNWEVHPVWKPRLLVLRTGDGKEFYHRRLF